MANFYDYKVTAANGDEVNMADLKGKVVMVVNTATGCGFTPQYEPIEKMYRDYHDKGLEILDIPCNGENELPLYTYLKSQKGFEGFGKGLAAKGLSLAIKKFNKDLKKDDIQWNFTKFIIDRQGNVVARFEPTIDMKEVENCVVSLL